jgi:hypothetical protein
VPCTISATAASAVNGGHTTTSAPLKRFGKPSRMAVASARASTSVPCIFQLPMTSGVRITRPR